MPVTVTRVPDTPIITAVLEPPFNVRDEAPEMFQAFINIRDTIEGYDRYFVVIDASQITFGFSEIVGFLGESRAARQQRRDDMPVSVAIVGTGALVEMATNALSQQQYGGYKVRLFTSLDDALDAIHAELMAD